MRNKAIEFTKKDIGNRFKQYTLDGGDNYRFNAYVYNNNPGQEFRNETHFNSLANVIGHTRYKDREGANGEAILFIEEFQSDWHQKGRQEGYVGNSIDSNKIDRLNYLRNKMNTLASKITEQYGGDWIWDAPEDVYKEYEVIESEYVLLKKEIDDANSGIPDAPLKESITDFLIKQAIKDAEGGYSMDYRGATSR